MTDELRKKTALFRYSVLSPLIIGDLDDTMTKEGFFKQASLKKYRNPEGYMVTISPTTLSRWYKSYQKDYVKSFKM